MRVDLEVIVGKISRGLQFFASVGSRAVEYGRKPYCRGSYIRNMVEGLNNSSQVAVFPLAVRTPKIVIPLGPALSVEKGPDHHLIDRKRPPVALLPVLFRLHNNHD